jgi:hypothetical protein
MADAAVAHSTFPPTHACHLLLSCTLALPFPKTNIHLCKNLLTHILSHTCLYQLKKVCKALARAPNHDC